eukprot:scaffold159549_cov17-Tisochrysis_lutea.AAC.1
MQSIHHTSDLSPSLLQSGCLSSTFKNPIRVSTGPPLWAGNAMTLPTCRHSLVSAVARIPANIMRLLPGLGPTILPLFSIAFMAFC